jgi:hypothetical protein
VYVRLRVCAYVYVRVCRGVLIGLGCSITFATLLANRIACVPRSDPVFAAFLKDLHREYDDSEVLVACMTGGT